MKEGCDQEQSMGKVMSSDTQMGANREKYWDECDTKEREKRMYQVIIELHNRVQMMETRLREIAVHQHNTGDTLSSTPLLISVIDYTFNSISKRNQSVPYAFKTTEMMK